MSGLYNKHDGKSGIQIGNPPEDISLLRLRLMREENVKIKTEQKVR